MTVDEARRRFLRQLGIALAGVAVVGPSATACCGSGEPPGGGGGDGGDASGADGGSGDITGAGKSSSHWDDLREAWGDLDRLAKWAEDHEKGEKKRDALAKDHRKALDALVAAGDLKPGVADDMQTAFDEAAYHVWRSSAPISCYEPVAWPQYDIDAAASLAKQAELLEKHAAAGTLDEATLAAVRTAVQQDMAFLALDPTRRQEIQRTEASGAWRSLAELDLEIPPDSAEAAAVLVQVLAGQR